MEITQEELLRRLNSGRNLKNSLLNQPDATNATVVTPSREPKSPTPPVETQILAGSLALQGVPKRVVAEELNLTIEQVTAAKRTRNPDVAIPRDSSLNRVQELALEKTLQALDLMTPEKFFNAGLKDLAAVASEMSKVVERTRQPADSDESRIQIVVYAPETRQERSYKTIDV